MNINAISIINKLKSLSLAIVALTVLSTGCSINVQHAALKAPAVTRSGIVNVEAAAVGSPKRPNGATGRAGWGRFTIFAIPVVPVHVVGDGNVAIAQGVEDALAQAGYTSKTLDPSDPSTTKTLTCEVDRFGFSNYTYFFPIVPTWGNIELQLNLEAPNKTVLWSRKYHGKGSTLNFFDGYTSSCRKAMTSVLDQMVTDFSSDDFYSALNK